MMTVNFEEQSFCHIKMETYQKKIQKRSSDGFMNPYESIFQENPINKKENGSTRS